MTTIPNMIEKKDANPSNPAPRRFDNTDRLAFLELLGRERERLHGKTLTDPNAQTLFNTLGRIQKAYGAGLPF